MGEKAELAEDRTDLAEDRTLLASERTFGGWMRTGLTAVGVGVGFNALFQQMQPAWAPKALATVFIAIGMFIFAVAAPRAVAVVRTLDAHRVKPIGPASLRLIAYAMTAAAAALIGALWLLS